MSSNLFNRMLLAFRAGLQFHGKRNLYEVFGYPQRLTTNHLLVKYQRQDLTSRIVNMAPEEMWSDKPLIEQEDIKQPWEAFASRFQLFDRIIQADKLCAFGPFSVLWLGLKGQNESPAQKIRSLDDVLYIQAYGGDAVRIKELETNTSSPRFGQPVLYEVTIGEENQSITKEVHHSRIIHIVDRPLQGQLFGEPRLAQIYNVLEDILKMTGGSAELYWLTANRGMQVDVDKEMQLETGDAKALSDELEEFQHQLRRYIRTRGVKITNLGGDVADPRGVFETLMSVLAGTTSIPQRILMGSEAGQLASEQDRANWAEYITRRRTTFGEPYVLKPTLKALGTLGYLPEGAWEKAIFVWPEAFHMNPVEEANAVASRARAVVNISRRNQFGDPVISEEEARTTLGLPEKVPSGHTMPKSADEIKAEFTSTPSQSPNPGGGGGREASPSESPSATTRDPGTSGTGTASEPASNAQNAQNARNAHKIVVLGEGKVK